MLVLLLSLMFIASELDRYIEDCKKRTHFCKDQFFCVLNMLDSSFKKNLQLELTEKCMQECNQVKPCARRTKCTFQCLSSGRNFEETRITPDIQKLDSQTEIGDVWAFFILIFFFLGIIFMILICWFCIDQCCKKEINEETRAKITEELRAKITEELMEKIREELMEKIMEEEEEEEINNHLD